MKKALILGITGQDGSYLAEVLLERGYDVHGMIRKSATGNTRNIEHILDRITLHRGDMADATSIYRIIDEVRPREIYNEADQDSVGWSFGLVGYAYDLTAAAVGRTLEIVKQIDRDIRFFQPVSSNIFGRAAQVPQTEETPLRPQSPYGCAKAFALIASRYYRDVFGMFVSTGIFYNHESPRRLEEYVTRKITRSAVRIAMGSQDKLLLGDPSAEVDVGYAREYMEAVWQILQLDEADDFIISTGETHTLQEIVDEAFGLLGLDPSRYLEVDPDFSRPGNPSRLVGDYSRATRAFGFSPKVKIKELVRILVEHDMKELGYRAP